MAIPYPARLPLRVLWVVLQTRKTDLDCSNEKLWPDYGNNGDGDAGQVH